MQDIKNSVLNIGTSMEIGTTRLTSVGSGLLMTDLLNPSESSSYLGITEKISNSGDISLTLKRRNFSTDTVEDSTNAYQPHTPDVGTAILSGRGRYVMNLEVAITDETWVKE